jgi:hypothetical protein
MIQELGFYSFWQETMSNLQWYKKFNTKVDVGPTISVTQQHKVHLEYVAQENHTDFRSVVSLTKASGP